MDDREKLIELITNSPYGARKFADCFFKETIEKIADHLIANGVTVQKQGKWFKLVESKHCTHTDEYCDEIYYNCLECDFASDWASPYCPSCGAKMDLEVKE